MNSPPDNSGKPKGPPRMGPTSAPPAGSRPPMPPRQPMGAPPSRPAPGAKPAMPKVMAPVPEELDAGPTPLELPSQEGDLPPADAPELEAQLAVGPPDEVATGPSEHLPPLRVPAPSARTASRQALIPPPPGPSGPSRAPAVIAPPPPPATSTSPNIAPVVAPAPASGSRTNMPPVGARPGAPLAGPGAVAGAAPRAGAPLAGPGAVAGASTARPGAPMAGPGAMANPGRGAPPPRAPPIAPPAPAQPMPPLSPVPVPTPGSMAAAAPPVARPAPASTGNDVDIAPVDTLLPPAGGVDALTAEQAAQLGAFAAGLDQRDYFQLLGIPASAAPAVIKKAFYSLSRVYHPDRFFHLTDEAAKDDINAIYKRVTEAYYVLRDDRKRKKYVADIAGPERATKIRFTEASEAEAKREVKKEAEEQIGTHPKGRQFWAEAEKCLARDDIDGAGRNLKMALTFEPSNARYKEELAKVQVKLDAKWKSSGDKFKIR